MANTGIMSQYPDNADLWVEQESVVISANSHPTWDFYPEFLLDREIVPSDWVCSQHTRDGDKVEVRIGPSIWQMYDTNLWITTYPDLPLWLVLQEDYRERTPSPSGLAYGFLHVTPALPSRRFWFVCRISVVVDHPIETLADLVHHPSAPSGFALSDLRSTFGAIRDGHHFSVNVSGGQVQQQGESLSGLSFECYATPNEDLLVEEMMAECSRLTDRLEVFRQFIIDFLSESRSRDDESSN